MSTHAGTTTTTTTGTSKGGLLDSAAGWLRREKQEVTTSVAHAEAKAREMKRQLAAANDGFRTPYASDIGSEYDVTFNHPPLATRLVLTTPPLWRGARSCCALTLTSVHEGGASTGASQEQITANARWCDTFGPAVAHTPTMHDAHGKPVRIGFEWNRPIHLDTSFYGCLPMTLGAVKPTVKMTGEVTDLKSRVSLGLMSRLSGTDFVHSLMARGPYGTATVALQNQAKMPLYRTLTGSAATTLWRDALRNRHFSTGVVVASTPYNSADSAAPKQAASVTIKAEYDEPMWSIDTTVKAAPYAGAGGETTFKLSDAHARVVYAHNVGQYPRWAAGASVGLIDGGETGGPASDQSAAASASDFHPYNEPESGAGSSLVGQLTSPVASTSLYYQLNPANKFKVTLDSNRRLRSTYHYSLTSNLQFIASFQALFPAFDVKSVDSIAAASAGIKPSLGIAVHINAE